MRSEVNIEENHGMLKRECDRATAIIERNVDQWVVLNNMVKYKLSSWNRDTLYGLYFVKSNMIWLWFMSELG